ncbi:MAG: hypothetical protein C5B47_01435 [Verrucomicrobia bacterium]|nr:MAG: hypothetical protein C5B47_01435 [Verrucomicrobiota bacterium]
MKYGLSSRMLRKKEKLVSAAAAGGLLGLRGLPGRCRLRNVSYYIWAIFALLGGGGCSLPPVKLATPEPMQVDIKMRVDVYQYAAGDGVAKGKKSQSEAAPQQQDSFLAASDIVRSNRRADIQVFKNGQYVGEAHDGLLAMLKEPPGDLGDRLRKTVGAENADRSAEMQATAQKEKIPLSEVQNKQGETNRIRAFKGEWIEKPNPDGTFTWVRKDS